MRIYKLIFILSLCLLAGRGFAQEDSTATDSLPSIKELLNMDVELKEELMNAPVSVAGQKDQIIQEAPSIISVITREDIANYGARDISEVLRMVPGFEFGYDVEGVTGLSFRGIWVHEGKALIMINGVMINDLAFGNANLIGTVPTSMIERIEIIRGPGSVLYGGFAEVVVINIVTRSGKNQSGGNVTLSGGVFGTNAYSKSAGINYGMANKNGEVAVSMGYSDQPLSTRTYTDFFGNTMQLNSQTANREYYYAIVKGNYKGFSYDFQRTTQNFVGQDGNTSILPMVNGKLTETNTNFMEGLTLKQEIHFTPLFKIEPSFKVLHGDQITSALEANNVENGLYGLDGATKMLMYETNLKCDLDLQRYGQLLFGGGYILNQLNLASSAGNPGLQVGPNPGDTAYNAHSTSKNALIEYSNKFDVFGITIGGRYESTTFGDAFAPRAGITYVYKKFNAKLLYGNAFRIPLLFEAYARNISYSGNLHPETSTTVELEMGYKFSSSLSARFNIFNIDIENTIRYDPIQNIYLNTGLIQSRGAEAELALRYAKWGGYANGSFAVPGNATSSELATTDKKEFLGVPTWKLNAGVYFNIKHLQLSPSATLLSPRTGQSADTITTGNTTYPAILLLNLSLTYNNIIKKVDLRLTGTNLLDQNYVLLQPYYGLHAPMPAYDRHITLTAIINL